MKKIPFIIIITVLFLASLAIFFQKEDVVEEATESERLQVAATIFPLYDIVKNIAGDNADVHLIVPSGVSPHTFEITPIQMRQLQGTNILFEIGLLDEWASLVVKSEEQTKIITLSDSVELLPFRSFESHEEEHAEEGTEEMHEHEGFDPHYWLSVSNAKKMAEQIYNTLILNDPQNTDSYAHNLIEYTKKLETLDKSLKESFRNVENLNIITFHDSWQYFEKEYGIETVAVVESSPGVDLLPDDLKKIHQVVEEYNIGAIFSEPQLATDQIQPFIEDLHLTEYILDPLGGIGERDSYISMMQYNADIIYKALMQ